MRPRKREPPLRRVGRDACRPTAHGLDLAQRRARDEVAEHRRDDERDREDDEQLHEQPVERLVAVVERFSQHDDAIVDRSGTESVLPIREVCVKGDRAEPGSLELGCREQRFLCRGAAPSDNGSFTLEHLREFFLPATPGEDTSKVAASAVVRASRLSAIRSSSVSPSGRRGSRRRPRGRPP